MVKATLSICIALCGLLSVLAFQPQTSPLLGAAQPTSFGGPRQQRFQSPRKSETKLSGAFLAEALATVDTVWRTFPYAAAALTCGVKASGADFIAQKRQFHKRGEDAEVKLNEDGSLTGSLTVKEMPFEMRRNFAYIIYGSLYQGITQEYVYNHLYPVFFGFGTDVRTVLIKVGFDLLIQTTLVTLPIAYLSKALIYRYSFREALRRYVDDILTHGLLTKYFCLWGPVQCLTFGIIPEHFRVTFIAMVSFFWIIILSSIASKTPIVSSSVLVVDDECSLVDGQTCNIDG
jgi:protein Mpv17